MAERRGTNGKDTFYGTSSNGIFYGYSGNDTLFGSLGADQYYGGNDIDTVSYAFSSRGVLVNLARGKGAYGDAAGDTYNSIENVTGSIYNDTLIGNGLANVLSGGNGRDTLNGGSRYIEQDGDDAVLHHFDHTITLENVNVGDLSQTDFIF